MSPSLTVALVAVVAAVIVGTLVYTEATRPGPRRALITIVGLVAAAVFTAGVYMVIREVAL